MIRTAFLWIILSPLAFASNGVVTPLELQGVTVITPTEVKAVIGKNNIKVIDVRNPLNFGRGHLPGAVMVVYDEKSEKTVTFDYSKDRFDISALPKDKATTLIFYSHGITGWKSYKACVLAKKAGYIDVRWMREGYDGWRERQYDIVSE